jgi:hypothetical protein
VSTTALSASATQQELVGMPPAFELTKGEVVVSFGSKALFVMDPTDRGMRNLAVVALTRAGVKGVEVAGLFEIRPENVSRLRRLAGPSWLRV